MQRLDGMLDAARQRRRAVTLALQYAHAGYPVRVETTSDDEASAFLREMRQVIGDIRTTRIGGVRVDHGRVLLNFAEDACPA